MPTLTQLAQRANVALNTVRKYPKDFPDLFSEGARGLHGNRIFTDEDAATFCTLVALKDSGMSLADAAERIRSQEAPTIIDVAATQASEGLQTVQDAAITVQVVRNDLQRQIDALRNALTAHTPTHRDIARAELRGGLIALAGGLIGFTVMWLLVNGGL